MYAKRSPKIIGMIIGFKIRKVSAKIARIRTDATTLFMPPDSAILLYDCRTYKVWENL